nr:hypothetical protein Itr_chr06CG00810 [Ipomoea trifida]GMD07098.1 hypothetical protein Iba_chr06cCG3930 [Ipomoea batatas]
MEENKQRRKHETEMQQGITDRRARRRMYEILNGLERGAERIGDETRVSMEAERAIAAVALSENEEKAKGGGC